ncbi:hypothetical protein C8R46DRAFT_1099394 [Mycena filopes]|nr:hypothetical protein C8R46DRAFT_1099394 [Mycena filopes]
MHKVPVPQQQRDDLVAALETWRTAKQAQRAGGRSLLSKRVLLSDTQMRKLAEHGTDFLREATVTPDLICKLVPWDLASQDDLKAVAAIIMDWRLDAQRAIGLTPRGGHRSKQQNTMPTPPRPAGTAPPVPVQGIAQPSFSPAHQRGRGRGRPRGRGRGRGAGPASHVDDANFFATSVSAPPRTMVTRASTLQTQPPTPYLHLPPPISAPSNSTQPYNPYLPYYAAAYAYPSTGMGNTFTYPMYSLPPRYYPPGTNPPTQDAPNAGASS